MRILNAFSGIGGNRKLWDEVEVTAVEKDKQIAGIYSDFFPEDKIVIGDAHRYLQKHFQDFDFIWSSPPCQTHSRIRHSGYQRPNFSYDAVFPDMKLWQEIVFLKHHFKGKWVVENVIPYYEPMVRSTAVIGRHLYWSNFPIPSQEREPDGIRLKHRYVTNSQKMNRFGFDLTRYHGIDKESILNNLIDPEIGLQLLSTAFRWQQKELIEIGAIEDE